MAIPKRIGQGTVQQMAVMQHLQIRHKTQQKMKMGQGQMYAYVVEVICYYFQEHGGQGAVFVQC